MDYQKWIGKTLQQLQGDEKFKHFFALANKEHGDQAYHLVNVSVGIEAVFGNDDQLNALYFYSQDHAGFGEFKQDLPLDLRFELSDSIIEEILGKPQKEGGDDYSMLYGITPKWHKFLYKDFDLHIQYRDLGRSIELITLMKPRLI